LNYFYYFKEVIMKRICLILGVLMVVGLAGCAGDTQDRGTDGTSSVVYEDNGLKITFKGVSDVAGQIGMAFSLENNSESEITVLPLDSSVNGVMVQFVSGTLATIQSGKTFNQVWMCNPETVGVSNSEEVESIEVSFEFGDNNTGAITIVP
jgi:hypothetical protein